MKINIKTLSELTGFSQATVSNALHNKRGVNRETAEKILKAAREIGYFSDARISSIRLVVYQSTGGVVGDTPFFASLIAGVEAEAREFGYDTRVYHLSKSAPDYDQRMEKLCSDLSCGLLVLATELELEEAARFQRAMAPVVLIDNWYKALPLNAVLIDNADAADLAVSYLCRKGHRLIGHLRGNCDLTNFTERESGYFNSIRRNGLEYHPKWTFQLTPSMEGAYQDMLSILQREPELPTAFFAANDMLALGAIRALQQNGYSVPGDISVVGFDDLPFCTISAPPLTTIKVYSRDIGRAAVRRLMEVIKYDHLYATRVLMRSSFVERESVRDLEC